MSFVKDLRAAVYRDVSKIIKSKSDQNLLEILIRMKEAEMLDRFSEIILPTAYPIAVKEGWKESIKYLEENTKKFETSQGKSALFVNMFIFDMDPRKTIPEKWLVPKENTDVFKLILLSENIPRIQKYINKYGVTRLENMKVSLDVLKVVAPYYNYPYRIFVNIEDNFKNNPNLEISKIEWLLKTGILTTKEFVQEVLETNSYPIDQRIIMPFFELFKNTNLLKKIFDQGIKDVFICNRIFRSVIWANHKMGNTHKEILVYHRDKPFDEIKDFILDYKKYVKEQI